MLLLSQVLNQPKAWILTHADEGLPPEALTQVHAKLDQLRDGMPLPYVLGEWAFYRRPFYVNQNVLIPRPETELLVEAALAIADNYTHPRIADVGAGSGIIAVTLAAELPEAMVTAIDVSCPALEVARTNAHRHGQYQINFIQADLLQPLKTQFDLICANLPYIPTTTLNTLPDLTREPNLALNGGDSGLRLIQGLLRQARLRMAPHGVILLEIEATLGRATVDLSQDIFPNGRIELRQDLAGLDRLVIIQPNQTQT